MNIYELNSTNQHSDTMLAVRSIADPDSYRLDAERDAQDEQLDQDEFDFVRDYLPSVVRDMCENCDSLDDIGAWLDLEFETWLADLNHERKSK